MKVKTLYALCVLLLCGMLSPAVAKPLMLKLKNGQAFEGSIREVKDKVVLFYTTGGSGYRIPMENLHSSGKRSVKQWIQRRGGSMQYTSWIGTSNRYFSRPWPRDVQGPSSIGLKKRYDLNKKGLYVYETNHFRFFANTEMDLRVVERFSVLFETTHKFVTSLPLNASANYMENHGRFSIFLFGDMQSYYRSGGVRGSAGVYIPRNDSILIPLQSLGVTWNGKTWKYKPKKNNRVLVHELTHQLTAGVNFAAWYIEGSAEYVAATRYTDGAYHGVFHMKDHTKDVFAYVTQRGNSDIGSGRGLGKEIKMPSLKRFMTQSYSSFSRNNANRNYGVAALLTDFYYHKEGRGDGSSIKKYIKAAQSGASEQAAQKLLMGNKSYAQLEKEFQRYCARQGVKISFSK